MQGLEVMKYFSAIIISALSLWLFVPIHPIPFFGLLDGSWMQVVNVGFVKHWQWGRDIVFTIGPWGFLIGGYDIRTHWLQCLIWAILAIIYSICGWIVIRQYLKNQWACIGWMAAFTLIANNTFWQGIDARAMSFLLLLILNQGNASVGATLAVCMGLFSLVHISIAVASAVVIILLSIKNWKLFVWYCGSVAVFWLLAIQNPLNFIPWLRGCLSTVSNYGDAMSSTGNAECSDLVVWLVAIGLLVSVLIVKRRDWFQFIAFAFVIFAAFKHGFIRHDGHDLATSMAMTLVSLCGVAMAFKKL